MSDERKKIIAQIAKMEERLHCQQMKVQEHKIKVLEYKREAVETVYDHRIILLAALIPIFLWGWSKGLKKGWGHHLKRFIKVGLMTSLSKIKHQVLIPMYKMAP